MGKAVVISLEDETIKVVYASIKRKNVAVNDALILRDDQLDDFLRKEKTKEFIVVNSFKDFFQEIIHVPPAKEKFIKKLIELEIKKRSPFKDFSFIYTILGEKVVENRSVKEVFVFAVSAEELKDIVNRFILNGKAVKAIYSDIFSLASGVDSVDVPVLCVSEVGLNKNLFLIKGGKVQFVRSVRSPEHGVRDFDIQNINMTVSHCRHLLRVDPSFVILTGRLSSNYKATADVSIPVACLTGHLASATKLNETLLDFISPISALFATNDINLLTEEYRSFFQIKSFLRYSASIFLALSILGMGYIGHKVKNIIDTKVRIDSIRKELPDVNYIVSAYDSKKAELDKYTPFLTSLKNSAATPDVQRPLYLLSKLKTDNIRIDSLSVNVSNNILVELKGLVKSDDPPRMYMDYQRFIGSILALKDYSIKAHKLDPQNKSFHVELEYR